VRVDHELNLILEEKQERRFFLKKRSKKLF